MTTKIKKMYVVNVRTKNGEKNFDSYASPVAILKTKASVVCWIKNHSASRYEEERALEYFENESNCTFTSFDSEIQRHMISLQEVI
jgi:hypothetical protein